MSAVKELLEHNLTFGEVVYNTQIGDLTDAELLVRQSPTANHAAWQLGHLIASERAFMEALRPGVSPELPPGFEDLHSRDRAGNSSTEGFLTRQQYIDLHNAQRAATLAVLQSLSDADLAAEGPEKFRRMAPTVAKLYLLAAAHQTWHIGQITALRRHLNKPVVI